MHDVFICHASEDKESAARPIAESLISAGLNVWYDEFSLTMGDSLRRSIEKGIANSKFGAVIFSPNFFKKEWPQEELSGLFSKDITLGKTILPVWHNIDKVEMIKQAPILADRLASRTSDGIPRVVADMLKAINPTSAYFITAEASLSIQPNSVKLHSGEWSTVAPFYLHNFSKNAFYRVWIKLSPKSSELNTDAINVNIGQQQVNVSVLGLSWDCLRINGKDANNAKAIYLVLHTLHPNSHREFAISLSPENKAAGEIQIQIISTSAEPPSIQNRQDGAMALEIQPPEKIEMESISLFQPNRR